jgi:hypothetical protein
MDRSNHYEAAFEGYLQWHRLSYIAVDESRRSFLGEQRVKSLDFIVHVGPGEGWLIDVKGRKYPAGKPERPRRVWESWSTRDDVESLCQWAERFGPGYRPLLVFLYGLQPYAPPLPDGEELWTWHERRYLLRGVSVEAYRAAMRRRSPKWDTVMLPAAEYTRLARPFPEFLHSTAEIEARIASPCDGQGPTLG